MENVNIVMDSNSVISEFERFSPSDIDDPLFEICSDIRVSPVSTPETSENEEYDEEEVQNDMGSEYISVHSKLTRLYPRLGQHLSLDLCRLKRIFFYNFFHACYRN